ncbi:hypothetical protein NJH24_25910 [Pseudomonas asiatica]|uniref:hypothetical protein n=1 Tax=Pseudomonas asiatica TaxID=2219225 RepID=UPI00209B299F|nr:hypothetical protein [Pseudomonas asiatica]MCO7538206.1 hypothetical protein [Pseudomonas asiatica]MCO7552124.1 hypothetical protein [Pseudomonas asiatica]MCO7559664.1 hypothetical protein [Pseudomonas asiatica]
MATRNGIIIAAISLVGVITTGVFSNWDKLFSPSRTATNSPVVSDDFNVQVRYYIETSGFRNAMEALEKQRAERYRLEFKADKDTVDCMLDMSIPTNQLVDIAVDAIRKHFTLEEIKELNRINAMPAMVSAASKQAAISLDLVSGLEDAAQRMKRRNLALARANRTTAQQSAACPTQ